MHDSLSYLLMIFVNIVATYCKIIVTTQTKIKSQALTYQIIKVNLVFQRLEVTPTLKVIVAKHQN